MARCEPAWNLPPRAVPLHKRRACRLATCWLAVLCTLGFFCGQSWAAEDTAKPLAQLVPPDAGLYIEAVEPAAHWQAWQISPWPARLAAFPPFQEWQAQNSEQLQFTQQAIAEKLGVSPNALWQELLGGHVALALWPPAGQAETEGPGLLLVETQSAEQLARLRQQLQEILTAEASGVSFKPLRRGKRTFYAQHTAPRQEPELYWANIDNIGVIANRQFLIEAVIDRHDQAIFASKCLAEEAGYTQGMARLDPQSLVKAYLAPRAWDSLVAAGVQADEQLSDAQRQIQLQTWSSCLYVAASLQAESRLAVEVYAGLEYESLPAESQDVLQLLAGETDFLSQIPSQALVAAAGRVNVEEALSWLKNLDSGPAEMQELRRNIQLVFFGWDPLHRMLAGIGPGCGAFLVRQPAEDSPPGELPIALVVGMQLKDHPAALTGGPSTGEWIDSMLRAAMIWGAIGENTSRGQPALKYTEWTADGIPLRQLTGMPNWKPGWNVSFSVSDSMLVAGTSATSVLALVKQRGDAMDDFAPLQSALGPRFNRVSELLFVNARQVRELIREDPDRFLRWVTSGDSAEQTAELQAEQKRGLSQLLSLLDLADYLVVAVHVEPDALSAVLGAVAETEPQHAATRGPATLAAPRTAGSVGTAAPVPAANDHKPFE